MRIKKVNKKGENTRQVGQTEKKVNAKLKNVADYVNQLNKC